MASNIEETNVEEKSSENETGGVQAEKMVKHSFSDPWKGSDLVLVVEDEKFHVHRVILRLNSPVFEAMFNSQLKESTANEIPLPEKNASGVLDFLKIIYGFQYIQERVEITMENVEDLLQLSDEYQVKQYIFDPCVKFLEDQPKTKENVMKIVALANLYNLEKVHQGCIDLLKNMKLESLSETVHLQDLDKEQTQYYLTRRIERLERFLDEVFPQFFGVVASLVFLMFESRNNLLWCDKHVRGGKFKRYSSMEMMAKCSGCKSMLNSMVRATMCPSVNRREGILPRHGGNNHFNADLFSVLENFVKLTGKIVTFDG
ncbi:kelch-like protein 18 isoform X1 [Orbicella faveolata]|uniref:kelch-like protein 18 isoform X1 n=1 Tax=Orbicella faveolata TaxID=48498 RepID=UPI0009E5BC08|nr:kelch-like protein 18 isoform X1 [Orbicella faveolata]